MDEIVILNEPLCLIIVLLSLAMLVFDRRAKESRGIISIVAAALFLAGLSWLLLAGAGITEVCVLLLAALFLLLEPSTAG